jgi:hypothetical protein
VIRRLLAISDRRPFWLFRLGWLLLVSPIVIIPALGWMGAPLAVVMMANGLVVTHYAARWKLRRKARLR